LCPHHMMQQWLPAILLHKMHLCFVLFFFLGFCSWQVRQHKKWPSQFNNLTCLQRVSSYSPFVMPERVCPLFSSKSIRMLFLHGYAKGLGSIVALVLFCFFWLVLILDLSLSLLFIYSLPSFWKKGSHFLVSLDYYFSFQFASFVCLE